MSQPSLTKIQLRNIFTLTIAAFTIASCVSKAPEITDADWPQFKKDNLRSAETETTLNLQTQSEAWVYQAPQAPKPAWYGPAKEDTYAKSGPLPSMRDYDLAYYPIVVGDYLFYGSSADDALHCLSAKTGKEKWHFTTGGPIRVAPTYHKGNLYFGSDDGYLYCIDAVKGRLKWRYCPSPEDYQKVLNNGRLISFWPIRTGVLIEDGIAYFGASMLPWKKSFVCAINIETGKTDIPGTYVKEYNDMNMTLEGAMASTGTMLIQPQGRISPVFLDKNTGEKKGQLAGTGGCFVLVTPDRNIVHGHTSRYKSIVEVPIEKQPEFMTFKDGKEMVVKGDTSYVLNETSVAAYHRKSKKLLWLRRNYKAHRIIMAGDVLFAGGTDKVYGINTKNGLPLWEGQVDGTVYALSFANNALFASTNEGNIYCFKEGKDASETFTDNYDKEAGIDVAPEEKRTNPEEYPVLQLKAGPFIHALSEDSVLLKFETETKLQPKVEWQTEDFVYSVEASEKSWKHHFILPVRKGFSYAYKIESENGKMAKYEYDNFFNFNAEAKVEGKFPRSKAYQNAVKSFMDKTDFGGGICFVMGEESDQSAFEIAAQTDLNVINIEKSRSEADKFIETLQDKGLYGRKISALKVDSYKELPVISEIADLVWVNKGSDFDADEIIRLISPKRIALVNGVTDAKEWLKNSMLDWQVQVEKYGDNTLLLTKDPIENSGSWTHQYGSIENSSFGGESLWGSTSTNDFEIQWMGRPGPRFQTDRSGRKPSPLAVNGRLYVQGNERVIGLNVYNGTIYWAKDFPGLKRMNVLRDCSNWAADEDFLYMAIADKLHKVNNLSGDVTKVVPIKSFDQGEKDWGYIGVLDDMIIGSSTVKGSHFMNYYGGAGWYDAKEGPLVYKVLSSKLFAFNKEGVVKKWEYIPKGALINPTIVVQNNSIAFVESRSVSAESLQTGHGGDDIYKNTWLVSLDVNTGEKQWETRVKTLAGKTAYYMAGGSNKLVISSSQASVYDIQVFDAKSGKQLWKAKRDWFHGDHGAHMSKPAIVGNRLMLKPYLFNVETGEQISYNVPKVGHGCAHYALTEQSVFYRGGSVTQFNFDTRNFSKWNRLRPDCWLSTIPAEGMVLSPEAGGGCSCGNWLETSMVMAPISRAPITIKNLGETSTRDYKKETWGEYTHECNFDEFFNSTRIELILKPGVKGDLYYTIDGSEPNKNSTKYTEPFLLEDTVEVKAAVYIQKAGKERKFERRQRFTKVEKEEMIADK
uniref:outer membrane protein assembly factor BamB family protein n=1 Tax=uncultured Draconibacterium sp. TaxID=1573823 RepID=UPI003216ADF2